MTERFSSFEELGKRFGIEKNPASPRQPSTPQNYQHSARTRFMQEGEDYVSLAEQEILKLGERKNNGQYDFGSLTTSKIRNILSMVNDILKEVQILSEDKLPADIVNRLKHLKVRLIYEAGRDTSRNRAINRFISDTGLLEAIDEIDGDRKKFLRYANYLEALVAYHRFHGGKE